MRRIIAADLPLTREVWERDRLIAKWRADGETFKAEWAAELPEGEELTVYRSGDGWMDMCRGPHLASTGKLDPAAFKLTRVSGAIGAATRKCPAAHLWHRLANKKQLPSTLSGSKREARPPQDRREMDLFRRKRRAAFLAPQSYRSIASWNMRRAIDGAEVKTPQVMDAPVGTIGHLGKYRENMFVIPDECRISRRQSDRLRRRRLDGARR